MPGTTTEKAFDLRDDERHDEVGDQKRSGTVRFTRRRLLEGGKQREENQNRARNDDLPLEMAAVVLMRAHARGQVSYEFSVTRCAEFSRQRAQDYNGERDSWER